MMSKRILGLIFSFTFLFLGFASTSPAFARLPSAVQNVRATVDVPGKITITWDAPADDGGGTLKGFELCRDYFIDFDTQGPIACAPELGSTDNINQRSFVDTVNGSRTKAGVNYRYQVIVKSHEGDGPRSAEVPGRAAAGPSTPSTPDPCDTLPQPASCVPTEPTTPPDPIDNMEVEEQDSDKWYQRQLTYVVSFTIRTPIDQNDYINIQFPDDFRWNCGGGINTTHDLQSSGSFSMDTSGACRAGSNIRNPQLTKLVPNGLIPAGTSVKYTATNIRPPSEGVFTFYVVLVRDVDTPQERIDVQEASVQTGPRCDSLSCLWEAVVKIPAAIINFVATLFVDLVRIVMGLFRNIVLWVLELVLWLNGNIAAPNGAAKQGFDVTLQIANIGLVIAIIVIGFATILHRTNYAMQKTLPKLLLVAVLMNFSFFIAGAAIGLSDTLTNVFREDLTNFGLQDPRDLSQFTGGLSGIVGIIATALFEVIFQILVIFALIATVVMFLIRYVWLSLLLIGLPLVLVLAIFPNLHVGGAGGAWSKWLEKFTNWLLFGPVAMFFIWLAFNLNLEGANSIITSIAATGILVAGLMVAQKLGLSGSETAGKMAGWATRRAALYGAKGAALGIKRLAGGKEPGPAASQSVQIAPALQQTPTMPTAPTPPSGPTRRFDPTTGEEMLPPLPGMPGYVPPARTPEPGTEAPSGGRVETVEAPETVEVIDASPERFRKKTLKEKLAGSEFVEEFTKEDKNKKKTTLGGFAKDTIKGITGIEPSIKGFKHWAEGGDTIKDIVKSGSKELLGDPTHGPFKGIFGHTKSEEKKAKADKMNKIMKERLDKQNEFLKGMLNLSQDQVKAFQRLKKENAKEVRDLLRPGAEAASDEQVEKFKKLGVAVNIRSLQNVLTVEQHKEFDDNEDVIGIVGRIQDDLRKDELKEQYGVADSGGGGSAKGSTASHAPPASGGGGGGHGGH